MSAHSNRILPAEFQDRALIKGTLTTQAPLRIGDGGLVDFGSGASVPKSRDRFRGSDAPGVGAVATGIVQVNPDAYQTRPCIPARSLKGALRSWLAARGLPQDTLESLEAVFGSEVIEEGFQSASGVAAVGGKAEFEDCLVTRLPDWVGRDARSALRQRNIPFFDPARLTGIDAGVSIDRTRRTASDEKLFHHEFVPEGVAFDVQVVCHGMSDPELGLLLAAFDGFNNENDGVRLGADNGDGFGKLYWNPGSVRRFAAADVNAWLKQVLAAAEAGTAQDESWVIGSWRSEVSKGGGVALDHRALQVRLPEVTRAAARCALTLHFDGQFLVNTTDPDVTRKSTDSDKNATDRAATPELPNAAPLVTPDGHVRLPARSCRGVLRSHAERILRTIAVAAGKSEATIMRRIACRPDRQEVGVSERACRGLREGEDPEQSLCMACQLFGATGWVSRLDVSAFETRGDPPPLFRQEFVAIDRFTGGSGEHLKFNACFAWKPDLSGSIALRATGAPRWSLGLLALLIRDLVEGDLRFGAGASKGFGGCRAEINAAHLSENSLTQFVDAEQAAPLASAHAQYGVALFKEPKVLDILEKSVKLLENTIRGIPGVDSAPPGATVKPASTKAGRGTSGGAR